MMHLLIVDDDDAIRETLRTLFEDVVADVFEADSGEAALALLRTTPPPLVVLVDYVMAHLNGGELLRLAAAEGLDIRHRFLIMSASPARVDADPFMHQYALDRTIPIIAKPFDIDQVLALDAAAAADFVSGRTIAAPTASSGSAPSTSGPGPLLAWEAGN